MPDSNDNEAVVLPIDWPTFEEEEEKPAGGKSKPEKRPKKENASSRSEEVDEQQKQLEEGRRQLELERLAFDQQRRDMEEVERLKIAQRESEETFRREREQKEHNEQVKKEEQREAELKAKKEAENSVINKSPEATSVPVEPKEYRAIEFSTTDTKPKKQPENTGPYGGSKSVTHTVPEIPKQPQSLLSSLFSTPENSLEESASDTPPPADQGNSKKEGKLLGSAFADALLEQNPNE